MMKSGTHIPGHQVQILGLPITLYKVAQLDTYGSQLYDQDGKKRYFCGFRVGGGIDQDPSQSPQGYPDKGVYVTFVEAGGPADSCGLQVHDKILQVNGMDFTMVTHEKACKILRKDSILNMVVYRMGGHAFHSKTNSYHQESQYNPADQRLRFPEQQGIITPTQF